MNQAICIIRGVEGAEMTFFGFCSHPVYMPVIPDYTEPVKLNTGLKLFVRVHLRLGMNQRSRQFLIALNRLARDFEGTPNSGISVRPRGRQDQNAPPHMRGRTPPGGPKICQAKTQ